jgi:hypothetical protein
LTLPRFYILDERNQPVASTTLGCAVWLSEGGEERRQLADDHVGGHRVSTIFLLLDHRHLGGGPPLLFETMVFDEHGRMTGEQHRYSTYDDALAGHQTTLRRLTHKALRKRNHQRLS